MNVFLAGASGAIGRQLVPLLRDAGHRVGTFVRSEAKRSQFAGLGSGVFVADAFDSAAVEDALRRFEPEVVVNQLTAIPRRLNLRNWDRDFAPTNRLRTEGTDILLRAARRCGARTVIAQSFAGWPYARSGDWVKTEEDPMDAKPPRAMRETLTALDHLETSVKREFPDGGVVLRYGGFYGPGTSLASDGSLLEDVRKRKVPVIAGGTAVWSFIHVLDAARATLAALNAKPGVYNVTDDDPTPVAEWLPFLAQTVGAKRPIRIPAILGRLLAGSAAVMLMRDARGASNARAKRELNWAPIYASWRDGFQKELKRG